MNNTVLDLVEQRDFTLMDIWVILRSLKENILAKISFIVLWLIAKLVTENMNMFLMFEINVEMKMVKDYHDLYLKCVTLLLANVFEFFEKGARSRIFYISNRYSKANKKYLKFYDSKQEWKHVIFLDVNNLYGNAMSKFFQQVDSNE